LSGSKDLDPGVSGLKDKNIKNLCGWYRSNHL